MKCNNPTVESEIVFPKNTTNILELRVKRVPEGIEIFAKSKELENFFSQTGKDNHDGLWNGQKPYHIPNITDSTLRAILSYWGTDELLLNESVDNPNMSVLRSIGLGEGITMIIPTIASHTDVEQYAKAIKENVKKLYKNYVKPIDITVQLVSIIKGDASHED